MSENQNNTMHDNAIGWFFIFVVIAAVAWLIWHFFKMEIRDLIRWIRYAEMLLIKPFVPSDHMVNFNGQQVNWHTGFDMIKNIKAEQLRNEHLSFITVLAMEPLRWVFMVMLAIAGMWVFVAGPKTHNRKSLGLQGLIEYQSKNFPVITPFVDFDPSKQPPRPPGTPVPAELPLFAEALGPEEWLAYYSVSVPDGEVDRNSAAKAFKRQLIGRWRGVKGLKNYQQILLAAFCLKASRKRNEADAMLGRLAVCWSHDKGLKLSKDKSLLKDARKVLNNKDLSSKTLAQCNRHAYVTTALMRALQFAREEGGVMAPAQFVWMRAHDRTLWYPLNNLGRQSHHTEALGAVAHFKAERLTQRPIPAPKIDTAVDSIADYMKDIKARPIPELDYSNSKKKAIKKAV